MRTKGQIDLRFCTLILYILCGYIILCRYSPHRQIPDMVREKFFQPQRAEKGK